MVTLAGSARGLVPAPLQTPALLLPFGNGRASAVRNVRRRARQAKRCAPGSPRLGKGKSLVGPGPVAGLGLGVESGPSSFPRPALGLAAAEPPSLFRKRRHEAHGGGRVCPAAREGRARDRPRVLCSQNASLGKSPRSKSHWAAHSLQEMCLCVG